MSPDGILAALSERFADLAETDLGGMVGTVDDLRRRRRCASRHSRTEGRRPFSSTQPWVLVIHRDSMTIPRGMHCGLAYSKTSRKRSPHHPTAPDPTPSGAD